MNIFNEPINTTLRYIRVLLPNNRNVLIEYSQKDSLAIVSKVRDFIAALYTRGFIHYAGDWVEFKPVGENHYIATRLDFEIDVRISLETRTVILTHQFKDIISGSNFILKIESI